MKWSVCNLDLGTMEILKIRLVLYWKFKSFLNIDKYMEEENNRDRIFSNLYFGLLLNVPT